MSGKIDFYYDCNSPYSWFALTHLRRNKNVLASHGVSIELFPVFLGGIMQKSGNKPPWTNKAKAKLGNRDRKRASKYFGLEFEVPPFFPIMSLLPMRCMTYVKDNYPPEKLEEASNECWKALWQGHLDLSKSDEMRKCLEVNFETQDVDRILQAAASAAVKEKLLAATDRALESGAYGCPWFEVTNSHGKKEPFFGSDRFHHMWEFLGLPWKDIEILTKSKI